MYFISVKNKWDVPRVVRSESIGELQEEENDRIMRAEEALERDEAMKEPLEEMMFEDGKELKI